MRLVRARGLLLGLLLGALGVPAEAPGQASPLLPPGHWAEEALWRIEALGLVPDYLAASRSVPRDAAGEVLRRAAAEAEGTAWEGLAGGWLARFGEEFPEALADDTAAGAALLGGSAAAGFTRWTGRVSPGIGEFPPERTGPAPRPDLARPWAGAELAARPARALALAAAPRVGEDGVEVPRWDAALGWGGWSLAAGRGSVGYGVATGGGVLFSGAGTFHRVELSSARPFRLPGFLERLGPVALHAVAGRLPGDRHPGEPFLAGVRLSARVHPRVTLAGQRAAMIGGSGIEYGVTPERLWKALIGQYGDVENQLASVEARVHLPTEALLPISLHCEWGAEDTAGAFTNVPGILCGVFTAALPRLPEVAAGVEYAHFGGRCCGNPPWYRHKDFLGGWALEGAPLGHPVGGEGEEWLAFARGSHAEGRVRTEVRAFRRERGPENLFVSGRDGDSFGVGGGAAWRLRSDAEVGLEAHREAGDGWTEARIEIVTRILF